MKKDKILSRPINIILILSLSIITLSSASAAKWDRGINLGVPFDISYQETKIAAAHGIKIYFDQVLEDSRCPDDVSCFWEGRAVLLFQVQQNHWFQVELINQAGQPNLGVIQLDNGYQLELLAVKPQAKSNYPIPNKRYRATMVLKRTSSIDIVLGKEFILDFNQTGESSSGDLSIKFEHLIEDSRCAIDLVCFWEGRAVVGLSINNNTNMNIELSTENANTSTIRFNDYHLKLIDVYPYPRSGVVVPETNYSVKLLLK